MARCTGLTDSFVSNCAGVSDEIVVVIDAVIINVVCDLDIVVEFVHVALVGVYCAQVFPLP